jgi:hypothetical protein
LPKLERWERESRAVFEASKTAFIHFTRYGDLPRDSVTVQHQDTQYDPVLWPAVRVSGW